MVLTDVNECEGDPCLNINGGTCNDIVNGYNCSCREGFTRNRCETGGFQTVICIVHVLCSDTNFMKVVCQAETQ